MARALVDHSQRSAVERAEATFPGLWRGRGRRRRGLGGGRGGNALGLDGRRGARSRGGARARGGVGGDNQGDVDRGRRRGGRGRGRQKFGEAGRGEAASRCALNSSSQSQTIDEHSQHGHPRGKHGSSRGHARKHWPRQRQDRQAVGANRDRRGGEALAHFACYFFYFPCSCLDTLALSTQLPIGALEPRLRNHS
ncbi:hypothetical protein BDV93DRAFT_348263 [Ceratobasidium sp. AG-I]|nr:hypothetical protein BDV93DRAFT_348263 [Ceratobasidium sp. AG-I]